MSSPPDALERRISALEAEVAILKAQAASPAKTSGAGQVATDYEMSGEYGDPVIRKDPKRWNGASYVGLKYSQCPAEYLDTLAGFLDWKGEKDLESGATTNAGKPRAPYSFKDAARARGWAQRIRAGYKPPPTPPTEMTGEAYDDAVGELEVPF